MEKRGFLVAVLVLAVALTAWLFGGKSNAPQAASVPVGVASPASAGTVVVVPSRDLTFLYVLDANDGNVYVIDISGGAGEVRGIKLAGNFRAKKVY